MADPVVHITNGIPDSGTGNITTLGQVLSVLPLALGTSGGLKVDGSGTALPISGAVTVTGSATVSGSVTANAGTNLNTSLLALESGGNLATIVTTLGAVTASPTANTISDRLKTINTTLGSPFQAGASIGNTSFNSVQSGTWTVQPGNTANTTAWLVTGTGGTFPATQSGTWNLSNISGTISLPTNASTSTKQSDGSQKSQIVDGSGNVIGATSNALDVNIKSGGGSGGTSATFGAAMPSTGTAVGLYDGTNMVRAKGDETSGLWVNIKAGAGSGGTAIADEAAFTFGTTQFTLSGGVFQTTATSNPLTTGQAGALQLTANRAAHINLRTAAGVEIGTSGSALRIDPTGTTTQPISAVATSLVDITNLSTPISPGAATATKGMLLGGQWNSTQPSFTTGQQGALQINQGGDLRVGKGVFSATLSAWNNGTSINATQVIYSNSGAEAVLVNLTQTTTITGGAITFEVSYDGTNWVTIPADAVTDPASVALAQIPLPYTLVASTNKPFNITSKGWQGLRIKLSSALTGTGSVTPNYTLLEFDPGQLVISRISDGTNAAAVKAASTAPIATDPALVVAISPNTATLPVSLTSTTITGTVTISGSLSANQSVNVSQINAVTPLMGNGVTGTGSQRVTIASDNTAFSVNAVQSGSWSLTANQSVNAAQINGVTPLMGNGVTGTGSQRVTIASDNTAFSVNAVQSGSWSLTANQSVNVAQINGVTALMGNGVTGTGSQRVTIASDNTAFSVNAIQSGGWSVGASSATGSAVPANAFYKGVLAKTALPTAGTDGNLIGAMADKYGRQVVVPQAPRDLIGTASINISNSTTETTLIAAVASQFSDVLTVIVSNTAAAGTDTRIDFRDTTGGTIIFSLISRGGAPPGGMSLQVPIPQSAVNTNWTAQCASAVTDIRIFAQYVKNK